MLVKLHARQFEEDYGLLINWDGPPHVHMFEAGVVRLTDDLKPVPVTHVTAMWLDKSIKVHCDVADTLEKKRVGLQNYDCLPEDCGLYFPYPGYHDVVFHQGSVKFPLDLLFLKDSVVSKVQRNTQVNSKERWGCRNCDGVIEVNGGFCDLNEVSPGDKIAIFAFSEIDDRNLEHERRSDNIVRALIEDEL